MEQVNNNNIEEKLSTLNSQLSTIKLWIDKGRGLIFRRSY